LGQDIGEASMALAKRHLRSSVALAVFQPIYLAGMVRGVYDKGAEIFAELEKFLQDPRAFVSETIESIKAILSLPPEQIARILGESTGQSIRETIDRLKDQGNAYTYIFELGRVMGPLVAGVIIEIIFSKGVSWLVEKALTGLKNVIRKVPSVDSLSQKYRGRGIPSETELEIAEATIEEAPSAASARGASTEEAGRLLKTLSTEFTFEGEKHIVRVTEEGGQLVLWMCSNGCGRLLHKIRVALTKVDPSSAAHRKLKDLESMVQMLDSIWRTLPEERRQDELKRLQGLLQTYANNDPNVMRAVAEATAKDALVDQEIEKFSGSPGIAVMGPKM
jgi:hypothetical protein